MIRLKRMLPKMKGKTFKILITLYVVGFVGVFSLWNGIFGGSAQQLADNHGRIVGFGKMAHIQQPSVIRQSSLKDTNSIVKTVDPHYVGMKPCDNPRRSRLFNNNILLSAEPICGWMNDKQTYGSFVGYGHEFAQLSNVVIDPANAEGRSGGENMSSVWNQKEEDEYVNMKPGYFSLTCGTSVDYKFQSKSHLVHWARCTTCVNGVRKTAKTIEGFTIAVQRYEYVNLYHTMTDYYNAFLMMLAFDQRPENTTILWVDAHPTGGLDEPWAHLFSRTLRAGMLQGPTLFPNMVWSVMGYNSPLLQHDRPFVPYLEQFREFFLTRHGITYQKSLNCNYLNVLFLWRRDYIAHPRNPSGMVKRKFANEEELLKTLQSVIPGHNVTGLQLDILPMKQQLHIISQTDVLIGMHGAGLSHTLFLPVHGGLIELYPTYWSQSNRHFRAMASWRGLQYQTWQNHDNDNEKPQYFTYVPPKTLLNMFVEIKTKMCKGKKR